MPRRKIKPSDPQDFVDIDRIIHEPARLVIMANLSIVESADFVYLLRQTGMTWGNLSSHIRKLEEVGYVAIIKEFVDQKPHTMARLTEKGSAALEKYRQTIEGIIADLPE